MINFNEIKYERSNYEETKIKVKQLTNSLKEAENKDQFLEIFKEINLIHLQIEQCADYADISNMRNDTDEFYQKEMDYWNEFKPKFDLLFMEVYELCIHSPFKEELKGIIPDNFFHSIEYKAKISSENILKLQKKDNKLKSAYKKVLNKKTPFKDGEYNLSYIVSFFSSADRNERKEAHDAYNDFFLNNQNDLDTIFHEMINNRNEIAHMLGFNNYSEMSILSQRRFGYDYKDIKKFRDNIKKYISSIASEIKEMQKKELGLDSLEYYDTIFYKEPPTLLYTGKDLLIKMKDIFSSVSSELGDFYSEMLDNDYVDLVNRDHKLNFAITNYLTLDAMPVITGNFKNKYTDLTTLTHEVGHSFQKYIAGIEDKKYIVSPLLKYPTFEIAEMFSFSMELICLPHIKNLFSNEDYKKFVFLKMKDLITTMPYIAVVDEFQEQIYSKENITVQEIKSTWLELCNDYGLKTDNIGHLNLENGNYFYRQNHIFLDPFYYIDYAISYFGAFGIWQRCADNLDAFKEMAAVASYYPLCELVDKFNIANPFDDASVRDLAIFLKEQLNQNKK